MVYLFGASLFIALMALAWVDYKSFRLPDSLTLPLIPLGILQNWFLLQDWTNALIGAAVGYFAFLAIELGFKHLRGKDGLGRGDAKLLAAGGAWCGWSGLPFIVLIASGSGLAALLLPTFRKQADAGRIPFGPFLAFAIALVWAVQIYTLGLF